MGGGGGRRAEGPGTGLVSHAAVGAGCGLRVCHGAAHCTTRPWARPRGRPPSPPLRGAGLHRGPRSAHASELAAWAAPCHGSGVAQSWGGGYSSRPEHIYKLVETVFPAPQAGLTVVPGGAGRDALREAGVPSRDRRRGLGGGGGDIYTGPGTDGIATGSQRPGAVGWPANPPALRFPAAGRAGGVGGARMGPHRPGTWTHGLLGDCTGRPRVLRSRCLVP